MFEHVQGKLQAALQAFQVALVDKEAGFQIAAFQQVVELVAPLVEFADVARGEVTARGVEHLQVTLIDLRRALVVERRLVVMVPIEQFYDIETGDDLLAIRLQVFPRVGTGGFGRQRQST
ncbi:hypothetical protein D3C80_1585780 [compost metagenome]